MSETEVVRAWAHPRFEPTPEPVTSTLAADSWLVDNGRVLAHERHRVRFADAVADAGGDRHDALTAARRALEVVPIRGRWSPRLDFTPAGAHGPGGIRLRVRPAPLPTMSVAVATATRDPRTLPLRKGPDLDALSVLQHEESARHGVEIEPILLHDGLVTESTRSAVLWWRDDVLCMPDARLQRLPSVTAAVIAAIARDDGIELREERVEPDALVGCEVWLANALRGIRVVSRWLHGPALAPASRAAGWQARLESLRSAPVQASPAAAVSQR